MHEYIDLVTLTAALNMNTCVCMCMRNVLRLARFRTE